MTFRGFCSLSLQVSHCMNCESSLHRSIYASLDYRFENKFAMLNPLWFLDGVFHVFLAALKHFSYGQSTTLILSKQLIIMNFNNLRNLTKVEPCNKLVYCIRYIFRESNFSRIGTSRHFRECLNSRSRSTNIAYTSRIHASGSEVNIFACC